MNLEEYIWYLFENYDNLYKKISESEKILLDSFIEKPVSSAYECFKFLNNLYKSDNRKISLQECAQKGAKTFRFKSDSKKG